MSLRLPAFAFSMLTLVSLTACDADKPPSTPAVPVSAPTPSAPSPPPVASSVPTDASAPSGAHAKQVADGHLRCLAAKDAGNYAVDLDPESLKGTFSVDGSATRRFVVQGELVKGLTLLTFKGYGAGDTKPANEKLSAGKSRVVTLVGDDNHPGAFTSLYFDADFQPPGVAKLAQVPCGK